MPIRKRTAPIEVDPEEYKAVKKRSVDDDISISAAIRKFLNLWGKGDKRAVSIVEDAKKK